MRILSTVVSLCLLWLFTGPRLRPGMLQFYEGSLKYMARREREYELFSYESIFDGDPEAFVNDDR